MSLTFNYERLAKSAGPKRKKPRPKRRKAKVKPEKRVYKEWRLPVTPSPVPEGTTRYYLSIPRQRTKQALDAGCRYDGRRWFIDNPPSLTDFTSWKPVLHKQLCRVG